MLTVVVDIFVVVLVCRERAVKRCAQFLPRGSLEKFHSDAVSSNVNDTTEFVPIQRVSHPYLLTVVHPGGRRAEIEPQYNTGRRALLC